MDLLLLLAKRHGEVVSKSEIIAAVWGDVHVNDDALARCVFKLRKALGDDARDPHYVETIPKRGYRLLADVSGAANTEAPLPAKRGYRWPLAFGILIILGVTLFMVLTPSSPVDGERSTSPTSFTDRITRADDFYSQFTRTDNLAAERLYIAVLDEDPKNAAALAGLSNTIAQKVIRYQGVGSDGTGRRSLTEALSSGWLEDIAAQEQLDRAVALADEASTIDPAHERAWRALGLALSAQRKFEDAERAYERALVIAPDDWGTMINLSELNTLLGRPERSTPYVEQAWFAMERNYNEDPVGIRPWHSATGLAVADAKVSAGSLEEGRLWFRRVLARDPLNPDALKGLASVLKELGDEIAADAVCAELAAAGGGQC